MNYSFVNLASAIILSIVIIFGWQHFFEKPRLEKLTDQRKAYNKQINVIKKQEQETEIEPIIGRKEAIDSTPRIKIKSEFLSGSISLKGIKFDDLILEKYRQELGQNTSSVALFSPSNSERPYFAEIGWCSHDKKITYPDSSTIWAYDSNELTTDGTVNLQWISPENVTFKVSVYLDNNYMFSIKQSIENNSNSSIFTQYYGLINKFYEEQPDRMVNILHQGMIGVVNGKLHEYSYDTIKDQKRESFSKSKINWLGITDKYWLVAFIPEASEQCTANYNYAIKGARDEFQANFMSSLKFIEPGNNFSLTHYLFTGPKKVDLLDKYEKQYDISLFDRAIDFGWLYILTKPIFNAMNFFYGFVGNFGISIMIVTVLIKLLMFTLANKSYRSMKKIKNLQPEMDRIKNLYADDKTRLNQEVMKLYKREKVNPVSGCLPFLLQIPVFFSIYKVLYVSIEMRHAPFFGWIQDLSAPDPTSIFNLFGLLPFTPPSFLMVGVWPLIMAASMFLQQKMTPQVADPIQAQVLKFMPLIFLFMFSSFPAGLLIYWSWNNILSIVQQFYINKLDKDGS